MRNPYRLPGRLFRIVLLVVLAGAASSPAPAAAQPGTVDPDAENPLIVDLIGRILGAPETKFSNMDDPSDCRNETLFLGTRDMLGKYVADPTGNRAALQDYLLSGGDQCHCAEAIIGKDFDILLYELGPETARYRSCYDIHGGRKARPR
jgi:hypothetical protein